MLNFLKALLTSALRTDRKGTACGTTQKDTKMLPSLNVMSFLQLKLVSSRLRSNPDGTFSRIEKRLDESSGHHFYSTFPMPKFAAEEDDEDLAYA